MDRVIIVVLGAELFSFVVLYIPQHLLEISLILNFTIISPVDFPIFEFSRHACAEIRHRAASKHAFPPVRN